jgi:hypothetical protein
MKIVCSHSNILMSIGIAATITSINSDTISWNPKQKNIHDMLYELKPDLLIITSEYINQNSIQALKESNTKFIVLGMYSSDIAIPELVCLPHTMPQQLIDGVSKKYNTLVLKSAANPALYKPVQYDERYSSDIFILSNVDLSMYNDIIKKIIDMDYSVKIVGPIPYRSLYYLGNTSIYNTSMLMSSTKLIIDFNHNIWYDAALFRKNSIENIQQIKNIERISLEENKNIIEQNRRYVLAHHTYYHRVADIFHSINLPQMALLTMQKFGDIQW